ncbi:MAG: hypothetical protein DI527_00900 [Chelatococcus sp.]|nr:MAG: hypothetical protein DI527_00900 [Chelatococcus sp.]
MLSQPHPRPPARRRDAGTSARMADFLLRHAAGAGSVTEADLRIEFSAEEIEANLEAAKALARRRGKGRP